MSKRNIKALAGLVLLTFVAVGWLMLLQQDSRAAAAQPGPGDLVRLHILANSDSGEDQSTKLQVRDAVVEYLTPRLNGAKDPAEAKQVILANKEELLRIAQAVVAKNGADYAVTLEAGYFDFPIRSYGTLVLPAGKYDAVRILLGEAQGKNWWCVLFPPLCFVDATNAVAVPANAGGNLNKNAGVEFKWKIAELWREKDKK